MFKKILGTITIGLSIASSAHAILINFDSGLSDLSLIPNGYGGLTWSNFAASDTSTYTSPNGYINGVVSPQYVAFDAFGSPATFSSATPFTFNSAYLTAAWNNGLNVQVDGYLGTTLVHSLSLVLDTTGPALEQFNWANIDSVTFTPSGGTPAGYNGAGTHFAMDNLTINDARTVPEPASIALVGLGLFGLGLSRRKSKSRH